MNQVIKSGTNRYHGDVFEFFRNEALNARNYLLPTVTPFKRNTFGGTLGGPIVKDKTFFFISYQGVRKHEGQIAPILQVLSPAERTGNELLDPNAHPSRLVPILDPGSLFESGQLFDPMSGATFTCSDLSVVTRQTPYAIIKSQLIQ